jgi:hypothetical protein
MTQQEVVQRIISEILIYDIAPRDSKDVIKMYISQAFAAGYDHRINCEKSIKASVQRERVFP